MARDIEPGDVIAVEGCPPATVKQVHPRGVTTTEGPLRFGLLDDLIEKGRCQINRTGRLTAAVLGQAIADAFAPKPLSKDLQETLDWLERLPSGRVNSDNAYLSAELRRRLDTLANRGLVLTYRHAGVTSYHPRSEMFGTGYECAETVLPNGTTTVMRTFGDHAPDDDQRIAREYREASKIYDDPEVFQHDVGRQEVIASTKASLRASVERQEREAVEATAFREMVVNLSIELADGAIRVGNRIYQPSLMPSVVRALEAMAAKAQAAIYDPFGGEGKRAA